MKPFCAIADFFPPVDGVFVFRVSFVVLQLLPPSENDKQVVAIRLVMF